jgi:hypoxia up-regulated 1
MNKLMTYYLLFKYCLYPFRKIKEWLASILNEQSKLKDYEQPKLLTSDLEEKADALKREINYLINKAKYFKPKTTTESAKKKSSTEKSDEKKSNKVLEDYEEELDTTGEDSDEKGDKKPDGFEKKEENEKSKFILNSTNNNLWHMNSPC